MIRMIFCLFLFACSSYAYFVVEDDYRRQVEMFKNLDIDISFLQDNMFTSMKEDISLYRQKQFLKTLENGAQFIPILRNMIQEAGIPEAFLYMAMAESGFSTKAYSKAKALGLWQFMSQTAKIYGLIIDDYVDERRDPIKSTEAAIKYLKALHNRFGKWYLAAMAYNCGEGRVARAIEQAGTDNLYVLLDEKAKYLPKETREYIRKVIVMAYLSEDKNFLVANNADHFLNSGKFENAFVTKELKGGSSIFDVAETIGMSLNELWAYNPHLNYFFTPPNKKKYHIYIPKDKEKQYERDFDASKVSSKFDIYVVVKGDSFYKIAKKYKVDYKIIKDFNTVASNMLKPGQKLIIPVMHAASQASQYYTIKSGDTLLSISSKYNLSVAQLKKINNIEGEIIYPGLKLEIPVK
ncbi:MAG: LysM peptidoglycan-binding domain-containing protein [Campylobacteraceae bacterium]|jgi:membrane-bound lytic murein transglycosylase D|nr:LysM peptidoglycan-binding domain-containing protein [Campylobacteraceae bacterium]